MFIGWDLGIFTEGRMLFSNIKSLPFSSHFSISLTLFFYLDDFLFVASAFQNLLLNFSCQSNCPTYFHRFSNFRGYKQISLPSLVDLWRERRKEERESWSCENSFTRYDLVILLGF